MALIIWLFVVNSQKINTIAEMKLGFTVNPGREAKFEC